MGLLVDTHVPFCVGVEWQFQDLRILRDKIIIVVELAGGIANQPSFGG